MNPSAITDSINLPVKELLKKREEYRLSKHYELADKIRKQIEALGYTVADTPKGALLIQNRDEEYLPQHKVAVFGSGEQATTGRNVHFELIKNFPAPVRIALLETPTGYEDNPHRWYINLARFLKKSLVNFKPQVELVPALRNDGPHSTNNVQTIEPLVASHYIHTGAGSPSYAVRHLANSKAYELILNKSRNGAPLSLASAAASAFGKYCLPVYELYYAGHDPYWLAGLDFFNDVFGLNLTIIPHWNNKEGGVEVDTRFAYMGKRRYQQLLAVLPSETCLVGVDEHTALIFDLNARVATVYGKGLVTVSSNHLTTHKTGDSIPFTALLPASARQHLAHFQEQF